MQFWDWSKNLVRVMVRFRVNVSVLFKVCVRLELGFGILIMVVLLLELGSD